MIQRLIIGGLLIVLTGCADGGHWMSSEYLTGRGWAAPSEQGPQDKLYCYRTLGKVDCYRTPQPGKGRLIEQPAQAAMSSIQMPKEGDQTPLSPDRALENKRASSKPLSLLSS